MHTFLTFPKFSNVLCSIFVLPLIGFLFAQEAAAQINSEGTSLPDDVSSNTVEFKIGIAGTYSNNFYYEDNNEQSVAGAKISPVVELTRNSAIADFGLTAKGDFAAFSYGNKDNYSDLFGSGSVNFKLPQQTILGVTAVAQKGHDPFGTERTEGQASANRSLDEWNQFIGSVALAGGQEQSAKLSYELKYSSETRTYQTNESATRFLDRQFDTASAILFYNFSPKFAVLAQGLFFDLAYDETRPGSIDRSGNATVALLGVRWDATAKTYGDLRVGRGEWNPDVANIDVTDSNFFQVALNWEPTQRTTLRATGSREYSPTYRFDAIYIDSKSAGVEWNQLWNYRTSTKLLVAYAERNFVGANEQHDYVSVTGRITFQFDRDVNMYVQTRYVDRDAVNITQQFDASTAIIGLEAKLN